MLKWFRNSREFEFLEDITIYNMPGKKKFTSKDYQSPLRKPGEKREDLPTQDGGKGTSSASNEAEKGDILLVL